MIKMNDCIWHRIDLCRNECKCEKYLSVLSDEGKAISKEKSDAIIELYDRLKEKMDNYKK